MGSQGRDGISANRSGRKGLPTTEYHRNRMLLPLVVSTNNFAVWAAVHWNWLAFHAALLLLLGAELLFSRLGAARLAPEARSRRQHRNAIAATVMWVAAAALFAVYVWLDMGHGLATQFVASYAIEESLSIDNLFVFLLLFRIFRVPPVSQPRVLFWGVLGAILMRGAFIAGGLKLLTRFHWVSYVFAAILLFAAIRLVLPEDANEDEDESQVQARPPVWVRWISRIHPVSLRQDVFFTTENGTRMITVLLLALLSIEVADVVFALDSIPAVLSITRHPFIAYTSNILAVMGLRSLFFLLAHALRHLRFLHYGLSAVLAFAAIKMLGARWFEVGPLWSLGVIVVLLAITVGASLLFRQPAGPSGARSR
jgi:tellurite resistance protein TerC